MTARMPANLGTAGRKLWRSVLEDFDLSGAELVLLEAAARQADDVATLEAGLRDGFTVQGSRGQPRLAAAVTEVRQGRLALARLLAELRLPADGEEVGRNPTKARAADARWNAQRRRLQAVEERHGAEGA
jgi:hypothetical protein